MTNNEVSLTAARLWAQVHAADAYDAAKFGVNVARAYLACEAAQHNAGDERATAVALAALSIRPEVLQSLSLLSSLSPGQRSDPLETDSSGVPG